MKSYELKPTYENLCNTYRMDSIGRNIDIKLFFKILNSLSDSYSIALDGNWGSGKTFFIKQTKLFIDAHNNVLNSMSDEDKCIFKIEKDSENEKYLPQVTVYYDAWENDNDNDPILSLIYSIVSNVDTDYSFAETEKSLNKAAIVLELFTGKNWQDIVNAFKGDNPLNDLRKEKDIEAKIKDFLDTILEERGDRLIIFIDELDRCKPGYAVKFLERIKHYFTNDRITFVFSINTKELQHTIKRHYGDDFDACRYLDRFFDLRISLPPANKNKFYDSINFNNSTYTYDIVCKAVIDNYNLSLREICKFVILSKIAAYEPTHESNRFNFSFSEGKGKLFCLMYIVPIMIGLKIYNMNEYDSFIEGKNPTPIIEVFNRLKGYSFNDLLSKNETFDENETGKIFVKLEDKSKQIYDTIFEIGYLKREYCKIIGNYSFERGIKDFLLRTVSLLSDYAIIEEIEE